MRLVCSCRHVVLFVQETENNQLSRDRERDKNHAHGIGDRAVESVKQLRVKEPVVRFV